MTELSRNLLNAAREGLAPDADVAARVRARVAAAVAAGAVATPAAAVKASAATPASTSTGSVAAISTKAGLGLGAKIGAALLVVGIAAVALVVTRDASPSGGVAALAPTSTQTDETATTRTSAATQELPAPAEETSSTKPAASPRASLAREVELIDLAMIALRKNTPAAALAAIATFDKETRGRGQMAEDAAAIALEAHCRLGHDVSDKLAAFDATYPSSAQRSRIRDACR